MPKMQEHFSAHKIAVQAKAPALPAYIPSMAINDFARGLRPKPRRGEAQDVPNKSPRLKLLPSQAIPQEKIQKAQEQFFTHKSLQTRQLNPKILMQHCPMIF